MISRARKGLTAVKTMACARMPQKTLVILFQSLVLSIIDYGYGLLNLSKTQLHRLDVIQNEGMRAILGCTKDTSAAAMRHILALPNMTERYRLAQVKAYLRVSADVKHPLHDKLGRQVKTRIKRGSEWMTEAAKTISESCQVDDIRRGQDWIEVTDEQCRYTTVEATLGRECREWPEGATNAEVETLIEENSKSGDVIIFTDGSVQRGVKSGWAFSARVNGAVVEENAGATRTTTSSMCMEVKAITEALGWLNTTNYTSAVFVTDSMSSLEKVKKNMLHADWKRHINGSKLDGVRWIFCPSHAGVRGKERADELASQGEIRGTLTLDPATVLASAQEKVLKEEENEESHTLDELKRKGIRRGAGRSSHLRGPARRISNQMIMETISLHTLRWLLKRREEQLWTCADCDDTDTEDK